MARLPIRAYRYQKAGCFPLASDAEAASKSPGMTSGAKEEGVLGEAIFTLALLSFNLGVSQFQAYRVPYSLFILLLWGNFGAWLYALGKLVARWRRPEVRQSRYQALWLLIITVHLFMIFVLLSYGY
jgi:hypothetical protein